VIASLRIPSSTLLLLLALAAGCAGLAAAEDPAAIDVAAPAAPPLAPADAAAAPPPGSPAPPAAPGHAGVAWGPFGFLGETIAPGESRRLRFESLDSFTAGLVALRGVAPGPTLCVTAGVHGDELNGIAIAHRLADETDPRALAGTLIVVPVVNAYGFRSGSRYLPDRRDLNRYFPGRPDGSSAARIAHQFFEQVVRGCDELVDLHTGSLNRANVPQIRSDLAQVDNLRLAWGFATEHVIHSVPQPGTLRRAADDAGIASVLYEAGEPGRIDQEQIERGVAAIQSVLGSLGMLQQATPPPEVAQRLYGRAQWVRADASGIYVPLVELGADVQPGQRLAEVSDPFSSRRSEIVAPVAGRVIGMALGQVVIPGFALFHIGIEDAPMPIAGPRGPVALPANGDDAVEDDEARQRELAEERPE
jgi:predicted deacylase